MQTEFDMVHLRKCPPQYQHLSGLLHVFKSKIGGSVSPVQVSARFTYNLTDWGADGAWPQEPIDGERAARTYDHFPFGSLEDPISDLQLSAIWPSVSEDMVIENDVHSDFDANIAPVWTVHLYYNDIPGGVLSCYMTDLLKLRTCVETIGSLISTTFKSEEPEQDIGKALNKLTENHMKKMVPIMPGLASGLTTGITKIASQGSLFKRRMLTSSVQTLGPISLEILAEMMEFLLPEISSEKEKTKPEKHDDKIFVHEMEHQIKSAPKDSVTYRLALLVTMANYLHDGVAAVAQIWHGFVQEMRYRFENGDLISGIKPENPDLRCCLLHQKLQMLNCCIQHKRRREKGHHDARARGRKLDPRSDNVDAKERRCVADPADMRKEDVPGEMTIKTDGDSSNATMDRKGMVAPPTPLSPAKSLEGASSIDEDEFFECDEGETTQDLGELVNSKEKDEAKDPINDSGYIVTEEQMEVDDTPFNKNVDGHQEAEGRLRTFNSMKLVNSNNFLYIPITQEPPPLTEDALEEQTKIFASLGDSAEGAVLRRKMQSASLHSDMESFKAANPGCVLEDFVRWYSPRDFEELKDGSSGLSDRMKIEGNLWLTMWEASKPVPARRQKRLFDDTKEGEKVLHFLSSLQPQDVVLHLLPMCFHEAILVLRSKTSSATPSVPRLIDQIYTQTRKLFQNPAYAEKPAVADDIMQKIIFAETLIERAMSLRHKFSKLEDVDAFVKKLIEHPEVELDGAAKGEIGSVVKTYFTNAEIRKMKARDNADENCGVGKVSLPPSSSREYILRCYAPRPSVQSRNLPHKMYAVLVKSEFRLAGAFSSDTVFF